MTRDHGFSQEPEPEFDYADAGDMLREDRKLEALFGSFIAPAASDVHAAQSGVRAGPD